MTFQFVELKKRQLHLLSAAYKEVTLTPMQKFTSTEASAKQKN